MTTELADIIRRQAAPLEPLPTDTPAALGQLPGVRAVLFDVYGTLIISGCGEIGTAAPSPATASFAAALNAAGVELDGNASAGLLQAAILSEHQAARAAGIEYPEVDIRHIWRTVLAQLGRSDLPDQAVERLALEYEMRANPVWPMPGARQCLAELAKRNCLLGIVSNAQFFTATVLGVLLESSLDELQIAADLRFYSYQHRRAKPGQELFQRAAAALAARGIAAGQALFIGNDMLNDVLPASRAGLRTALFAGDARSLRLRRDDPRVRGLAPDLVITDLRQLAPCISTS